MDRRWILTIATAAMIGTAAPAMSQEILGSVPCCGKTCDGTTSTGCGPILPDGLGTLSGCVGIDDAIPATCVGGQLLDQEQPALLAGCICVLGTCFGPLGADLGPMTPEECSAAARAACENTGNIVTTPNDAACGGTGTETNCTNGADDDGDGATDCADSDCASDPACQGGGGPETNCTNGVDDDGDGATDCADSDCAGNAACQDCKNRSGGGDQTNPGGGGNPAGCNNPGGPK